jgi:hypothetical protein
MVNPPSIDFNLNYSSLRARLLVARHFFLTQRPQGRRKERRVSFMKLKKDKTIF